MRCRTSSRASRSAAGGIQTVGSRSPPEQERPPLGVDAVVLEASGGDGLRLLGMREHRPMAEVLEEID